MVSAVVLVAGVASLAGCTFSTTPGPEISVPGLIGSGSGPSSAPLTTVDVCTAVSASAVAKAASWDVTTSDPAVPAVAGLTPAGCSYSGSDGVIHLLVVPGGGSAALAAIAAAPELGGGAIALTGLGDEAQATLRGIVVRWRDDVLAVADEPTGPPVGLDRAEKLVTALHDRLAR